MESASPFSSLYSIQWTWPAFSCSLSSLSLAGFWNDDFFEWNESMQYLNLEPLKLRRTLHFIRERLVGFVAPELVLSKMNVHINVYFDCSPFIKNKAMTYQKEGQTDGSM